MLSYFYVYYIHVHVACPILIVLIGWLQSQLLMELDAAFGCVWIHTLIWQGAGDCKLDKDL